MLRPPSNPRLPAPLPEQRAGGGHRPPNPVAGALMADRRTVMVAARVTPAEHAAWQDKAAAAGVSPSALLRQAMARTRTWTAPALAIEREHSRQIARIGNNLNQLARWANTHAAAVAVIAHLASFELAAASRAARRANDMVGRGLQDARRDVARALELMPQRGQERDHGPSR